MKRISKFISLSLCGLVLSNPSARASERVSGELVSDEVVKISILTAASIAGAGGTYAAVTQTLAANAREAVHGRSVFNGNGSQLLAATQSGQPSLTDVIMRGTAAGDVIRLEYVVGTEAAFERAVADLRHGSETWTIRVSELTARRNVLAEQAVETRRVYTGLPLNEQSKELRYHAFVDMKKAEAELKRIELTLSDADMRMHSMRGQHAAAFRNLEVTRQNHKVNQSFHLIRDVYVDGQANQLESVLSNAMGETTIAARAQKAFPHIRITRILTPNSSLIQRSVRNVKAGLWAVGISAALVVEEITVGEISQGLAEKARDHYSPETRIDPTGASGRRN